MKKTTFLCAVALLVSIVAVGLGGPVHAARSADPGDTVRNAFGPQGGGQAGQCRGTMPDPESENGMQALVGLFGKVLASADSPEDVQISITPLDEHGNPVETRRVGSTPRDGPPPIPGSVDLPAARGHLFVPMYQLVSGMQRGQVKERRVRCTHRDLPVLDTTFRLTAR